MIDLRGDCDRRRGTSDRETGAPSVDQWHPVPTGTDRPLSFRPAPGHPLATHQSASESHPNTPRLLACTVVCLSLGPNDHHYWGNFIPLVIGYTYNKQFTNP